MTGSPERPWYVYQRLQRLRVVIVVAAVSIAAVVVLLLGMGPPD